MTAALDAIRARHHTDIYSPTYCIVDGDKWPCDAAQLIAALDRAEAALRRIRDMDYRGNRSPESDIAREALDD